MHVPISGFPETMILKDITIYQFIYIIYHISLTRNFFGSYAIYHLLSTKTHELALQFGELGSGCGFLKHGNIFIHFIDQHGADQLIPEAEVFEIPIGKSTLQARLDFGEVVPGNNFLTT